MLIIQSSNPNKQHTLTHSMYPGPTLAKAHPVHLLFDPGLTKTTNHPVSLSSPPKQPNPPPLQYHSTIHNLHLWQPHPLSFPPPNTNHITPLLYTLSQTPIVEKQSFPPKIEEVQKWSNGWIGKWDLTCGSHKTHWGTTKRKRSRGEISSSCSVTLGYELV